MMQSEDLELLLDDARLKKVEGDYPDLGAVVQLLIETLQALIDAWR